MNPNMRTEKKEEKKGALSASEINASSSKSNIRKNVGLQYKCVPKTSPLQYSVSFHCFRGGVRIRTLAIHTLNSNNLLRQREENASQKKSLGCLRDIGEKLADVNDTCSSFQQEDLLQDQVLPRLTVSTTYMC